MSARGERTSVITCGLALLAAVVTAWQLSRPGLLFGVTPDVSVYVGGAVRLVHGAVPYRDFVFVQPPGFVLLATPLGWLSNAIGTRDALAVLRLSTPLIAAADVGLVGALLHHRGRAAVMVGCTVMALYPAELYAIRGPQLEPVIVFLCLGAGVLAFHGGGLASPRRLLLAGVVLGVAVAVKQTAVIPLAVVAVLCATAPRRPLAAFAGGAVAGFAVPVLPFFVLAPAAFVRDTVTTQLSRVPASGRAPVVTRLAQLTGVASLNGAAVVALAVGAALAAIVVMAFTVNRERPSALEWFALSGAAVVAAAQLAPALYYPHYAAFMAPFLALLLGVCAARLAGDRARGARRMLSAVPLAGLLAIATPLVAAESAPDVSVAVDAVVPAGGCAFSDSPVYLFTSDRFQAAGGGCTLMTDPAGTALALDDTPAAVAAWQEAFTHADYVVTGSPVSEWRLPTAAHVPAYVAAHFREVHAGSLLVYLREGLAAPGAAGDGARTRNFNLGKVALYR